MAVPFLGVFLHDLDVLLSRDHLDIRMISRRTRADIEAFDEQERGKISVP